MRAIFQPKIIETLRPNFVTLIGYEAEWDRSGELEGRPVFHMSRQDPRYDETDACWVPEEDLAPVAS